MLRVGEGKGQRNPECRARPLTARGQTSDNKAFTENLAIDQGFPHALIGLKAVYGIHDYRR
jgi:hypothetical protein